MNYKHFTTGVFSANELQNMRERTGKPEVLLAIGQEMRRIRKDREIERKSLAGRIGVSGDQFARFEHGLFDIGFAALDRLCAELNVDMNLLLAPHLALDTERVGTLVGLARSWETSGRHLSIIDVILMNGGS
jgi:transcriptional regulator with XRE-family HTH domain